MKMKLGDKFVLTNHLPYHYFTGHNTKLNPSFIEIEIIEEKENIPGEFTDKTEDHKGYLAKGSDGYFYSYNYERYYEGYSEPAWSRYISDEDWEKLSKEEKDKYVKDYLWTDVTKFQCPALPNFANQFSIKIKFCEKHQYLYYENKECFYCKHLPGFEREVVLNMEEHKWLGWYK